MTRMRERLLFLLAAITLGAILNHPGCGKKGGGAEGFFSSLLLTSAADITDPSTVRPSVNVNIKYKNAYYYEYDDEEYLKRLKTAFGIPPKSQSQALRKGDEDSEDVTKAYTFVITRIEKVMREASEKEMALPTPSPPIQTVVARLVGWNRVRTDVYNLTIECVFYRENKYCGKKVEFYVQCNRGYSQVKYLDAIITANVSEDDIALYPVTATNPFDTPYGVAGASSDKTPQIIPKWAQSSLLTRNGLVTKWEADGMARDPAVQKAVLTHTRLWESSLG